MTTTSKRLYVETAQNFVGFSLSLSLSLSRTRLKNFIVIPQKVYLFLGEERICEHAMRKYVCLDAISEGMFVLGRRKDL
jgi:hypothetical protein